MIFLSSHITESVFVHFITIWILSRNFILNCYHKTFSKPNMYFKNFRLSSTVSQTTRWCTPGRATAYPSDSGSTWSRTRTSSSTPARATSSTPASQSSLRPSWTPAPRRSTSWARTLPAPSSSTPKTFPCTKTGWTGTTRTSRPCQSSPIRFQFTFFNKH